MPLKPEDATDHGESAVSYDDNALIAFQLRARLDDFKFGITYQCMQELKWTYKNGSYRSPCGSRIFESSKQVEEALDRFAVPDIENALGRWKTSTVTTSSSNQQQPFHRRIDNSTNKDDIDRKLRENLLSCLFKKVSKKPTGNTIISDPRNKRISKGRIAEPRPKRGRRSAPAVTQAIPDKTTTTSRQTHPKHAITLTEHDRYLLSTNHSLLLYGYGSKRATLDDFASNILSQDGDVLEISGYDQSVRIDEFLDVVINQFLDGKDPEENIVDKLRKTNPSSKADIGMKRKHAFIKKAKLIAEALARTRDCPLYLVLYSIDGVAFRSKIAQEALAALVLHSDIETTGSPMKSHVVRLVASVDHVNANSLLQEIESWMSLNWLWKEIHTYQPYDEEVKASGIESLHKTVKGLSRVSLAKLGRGGGGHEGSLQTILTSLAKRHAETLQALAGLQLKTKEEKQPVDYRALRQECLHKMIAGQDSVLRDYLTELVDHEIVERIVDEDTATEKLLIPYPGTILQEILTFQI